MRVLVTGGTGVVGSATVSELLRRGHSVRLLSRNAIRDFRQWPPQSVEPWPASVSEPSRLHGSASGCDLVLHLAGIVAESPPDLTFGKVNVGGTRNLLQEATRAGVGRFIYVSSLGADSGESEYHRSKRAGEELVRGFQGGWIILRPGNVFGPGDDVVSLLLTMVRTLPVVPVIQGGEDPFQPIWSGDLAQAIAAAVERPDLHGRVLEIAGEERTTINGLLDHFSSITGRDPARISIPGFVARAGAAVAELAGMKLPVSEDQLRMLSEGNYIRDPGANALSGVLGVTPTPLSEGLAKLADALPEQLPEDGFGELQRRRIQADIAGSRLTQEELFSRFCERFNELTPGYVDAAAEPRTSSLLSRGVTITMSLPLRGNIQVRVVELTSTSATLVTLEGHPLAGAVRFLAEQRGERVRFEVQVYDRAANIADWFAMRAAGDALQMRTWEELVERMIRESGGHAPEGIRMEDEVLDELEAGRVEQWVRELVMDQRRASSEAS